MLIAYPKPVPARRRDVGERAIGQPRRCRVPGWPLAKGVARCNNTHRSAWASAVRLTTTDALTHARAGKSDVPRCRYTTVSRHPGSVTRAVLYASPAGSSLRRETTSTTSPEYSGWRRASRQARRPKRWCGRIWSCDGYCQERESQTHPWEAPPGGTHRPVDRGDCRPQLTTERARASRPAGGLSPACSDSLLQARRFTSQPPREGAVANLLAGPISTDAGKRRGGRSASLDGPRHLCRPSRRQPRHDSSAFVPEQLSAPPLSRRSRRRRSSPTSCARSGPSEISVRWPPLSSKSSQDADHDAFGRRGSRLAGNPTVRHLGRRVLVRLDEAGV
jgi:hypothetical protein